MQPQALLHPPPARPWPRPSGAPGAAPRAATRRLRHLTPSRPRLPTSLPRAPTSPPRAAPSLPLLHSGAVPPDPAALAFGQPVQAALAYAAREVALQVALPLLAMWALQAWLGRLERRTKQEVTEGASAAGRSGGPGLARELADLLPGAASAPCRVALAALTAVHVGRSTANLAAGLAERALVAAGWPQTAEGLWQGRLPELLSACRHALAALDRLLVRSYEVLLLAFGCWVLLAWKDVALSRFLLRAHETAAGRQDLERILTPLNTVASWLLVACTAVACAGALGVDVRPLLVLTGWGSVVAGLASQQLLANAISGVQMYMDRPFRVGDTISVTSGPATFVGEVVEVASLRTHLALEDGSSVAIPNRSLADMVITNKSRSSRGLNRPPWMQSRAPLALALRVRLRPAAYADLGAEAEGLRHAVCDSGAVESEGPLAPSVEVLSYSDRGVEVLVRCRLRNPSREAAAIASGNLAPAAALAVGVAGGGLPLPATFGTRHGNGNGSTGSPSAGGGGGGGSGGGSGGGVGRSDALRALRQRLLLSLGPWLQAHNASLAVE
ncbi:hypothetical protein HYH03_005792 [Edaphochlamys debaryana]|uniref:Mechanosensitive ion channel MscS domain-containing protein n=1 Tax=Edaphochlamys debaryana TaxID=47281 RepID=A0A835Y6Y6_9CHLO|nr:hypothetical protein HYH03_005792 [Edaphochlamys debaryana]|eukprot:KAG2496192.1 hypothetical protein HYH03_005792 [Edaphochlamys debaryana]